MRESYLGKSTATKGYLHLDHRSLILSSSPKTSDTSISYTHTPPTATFSSQQRQYWFLQHSDIHHREDLSRTSSYVPTMNNNKLQAPTTRSLISKQQIAVVARQPNILPASIEATFGRSPWRQHPVSIVNIRLDWQLRAVPDHLPLPRIQQ
jgi:hypothetical protein